MHTFTKTTLVKSLLPLMIGLSGIANADTSVGDDDATNTAQANQAQTDNNSVHLGTLKVTTKPSVTPSQTALFADTPVISNDDLVRYSTDMGVPTTGRFGSQGFNIRGVENNQVAISVDGVAAADSQNYATFSRYSYYNKSRPRIDNELMSYASISKGSGTGNGAMGGAVSYHTKSVDDVLMTGRVLGASIKHTYNGKNKEWVNTLGVGFKHDKFDALAVYSHRTGHEDQIPNVGANVMGSARGLPNPYHHYGYGYLGKVGVNVGDHHRFEIKALKQRHKTDGQELSYSTMTLRDYFDVQDVAGYGATYAFTPKQGILRQAKISLDKQDTHVSGINNQIAIATGVATDNTERKFSTKITQSSLEARLQPLTLGNGEHNINVKAGYGTSDFAFHLTPFLATARLPDTNMQAPVKSTNAFVQLGDDVKFGKTGLIAQLRYDTTKLNPSDTSVSDKTFQNVSGNVGAYYKLTPNWQVGYQLSKGFRVPTASEMYFNRVINSPMGNQEFLANNALKAESSLGHELTLQGIGKWGKLSASVYQTKYDELIDLATLPAVGRTAVYQSQNVHKATVKGVDVSANVDLGAIGATGFDVKAGFGIAKGERQDGADLLSIQPPKALLGIGYTAPNDSWSVHLNATHQQGKKAQDAQVYAILPRTGYLSYDDKLSTYPYLNKSVTTLDLLISKTFGEQARFHVGVYNLTNKQYHSWDALRTIGGTNPSVATSVSGDGLNRYLAPKRYVMASMEVKF